MFEKPGKISKLILQVLSSPYPNMKLEPMEGVGCQLGIEPGGQNILWRSESGTEWCSDLIPLTWPGQLRVSLSFLMRLEQITQKAFKFWLENRIWQMLSYIMQLERREAPWLCSTLIIWWGFFFFFFCSVLNSFLIKYVIFSIGCSNMECEIRLGNCISFVKGKSVSKDLRCPVLGINVSFHIAES